ncbi:MAG: YHS domain-containing protein, partial [Candidatus Hydrogenedentales bacterium]
MTSAHASTHTEAHDPVCGMVVDHKTTPHRAEHAGRTYYFCSAGCVQKFKANPDAVLAKAGDGHEPKQPSAIDPVCGMTVNPEKTPHRAVHARQTFYFCSAGCAQKFKADPIAALSKPAKVEAPEQASVIDPVCGMTVDRKKTPHHAEHNGQTYYFCSAGCLDKFQANPEPILAKARAPKVAEAKPVA